MSIVRSVRARGRWGSRIALSLTTILVSGLAVPAIAQDYRNLDENGIDLTHGDFVMSFNEGSIGSGAAELTLIRRNMTARATQWDNLSFRRIGSGLNPDITIGLEGGNNDRFTGIGLTPVKANGAKLVKDNPARYFYSTSDGTVITFENPLGGDSTAETSGLCGYYVTGDCDLLPTTITSPNGRTIALAWDLYAVNDGVGGIFYERRLGSITNSYGYSITFVYASNSQSDPYPSNDWFKRTRADFRNTEIGSTIQGSVTYAYPAANTVDVTDMASNTWRLTPTSIRRPGDGSAGFSVSASSGVVTSVTRDGVTTGYSRTVNTGAGTITLVKTDAASNTTTIVSGISVGQPTSVTNAAGKITNYSYDAYGRVTRVTAPEGNYVEYTYDSRGNVTATRMRDKSGTSANDIVTTASYDSTCSNPVTCNQPNGITNARSHTTNYTYNSTHGGVTAVTAPDPAGASGTRPETRFGYTLTNGEYLPTSTSTCQTTSSCAAGADEVKTSVSYNSQGQVTSSSAGAGDSSLTATTAATYTPMGDVATVDGPLSGTADTVTYRYDAARRLVGVISPDPDGAGPLKRRAEKRTYDGAGRATVIEIGTVDGTSDIDWAAFVSAQQVTLTYDANGRVTRQVVTASSTTYQVTQYSYDALGRLECTALRMNPANWNTGSACTANAAGSAGPDRITKNTYDAVGRVTKVQTGFGATEQADEVTTTYTDNGKVASVTDAEGNKTTYEYDGHDRVAKTRMPDTTKGAGTSSTTDYVQPTYDANGNVTSVRLRDGTSIGYTYDTLNRPTAKNLPGSEPDVAYTYDLLGRLTGASHTGNNLTFTYDALGRNLTAGSTLGTVSYEYDIAGRRTRMTWPNSQYVTYEYLVTGETTVIRENGATSGVGVLATYAYDNLGRRASLTFGNGVVTTYGVDNVSRLSSLSHNLSGSGDDVTTSFTYNPASQIAGQTRTNDSYAWGGHYNVGRNYTSNGLNQLTAAGGASLGYDARGNLTSSGSDSFAYSSENLLTSATVGSTSSTLKYDPLGRLFKIEVSSVGQRFLYDGPEQMAQFNDAGIMQRRYVRGPGADEVLVEYAGAGTTTRTFLQTDERGSVVARSDASGARTAINSYDEYGIPASGNVGRFQYTGQAWVPELGMYYYKARVYSPTLGRFLQADPIGYGDGLNLYTYVYNDPANKIDPSGLKCTKYTSTTFYDNNKNGKYDGGDDLVRRDSWTEGDTCTGNEDGFVILVSGPRIGQGGGGRGGAPQPQRSCLMTNGLPSTCNPSAGDPPVRPVVKRYICSKLSSWDYGVSGAFNLAFDERNLKVNGVKVNVTNPVMREGENFLFAARDGIDAFAISLYAGGKIVSQLWEETGPSFAAWRAGMAGRLHYGWNKGQWKEWCSAS